MFGQIKLRWQDRNIISNEKKLIIKHEQIIITKLKIKHRIYEDR